MSMPFSVEEFLAVFARYNEAVWPMPLIWSALAVVAVLLILRRRASTDRAMSLLLALLWIWMGGVYHLGYFRAINPAAVLFGALFLAEGVAFAAEGVWRSRLRFEPRRDARSLAAVAMISFALFGYPLASVLLRRAFPAVPTFGLPCPTTIFTLGVLTLARPAAPWALWIIPLAWSALGSSAALRLGMTEDLALPAAALAAALVRWRSADRGSRPRRLDHPAGWFERIRRGAGAR